MSDSSHKGVHFRSSFPCRGVRAKSEIDFWGDQFRGSALRSYMRPQSEINQRGDQNRPSTVCSHMAVVSAAMRRRPSALLVLRFVLRIALRFVAPTDPLASSATVAAIDAATARRHLSRNRRSK